MEEPNSSLSPQRSAAALSASALRELQQRAQAALTASRDQAARLEADITRQLDEIADGLSAQRDVESQSALQADSLQAEIARLTEELENSRAAWQAERGDLEAQRDDLARKAAEQIDLEAQRDDLIKKMAEIETHRQTAEAEWRNQLLDFERRLREQQQSWNEQRLEWGTTRAAIERERDELQQKFDLALQDVQRLRARVAEMEQDLARRPESNQADSAELVALRAERDALAARVDELQQRPVTQVDPNTEQQVADLQRRFELAVEDVRELKTINAKLEAQLAAKASASRPHSQPDAGSMDWESQKRRLLASLEGGDAHEAPMPKNDRATIEGTIEMTDAVVAEKDRQIAELQTQLAAANDGASCATEQNAKVKELLDADEVIAEHRQRIRELEREMQEKLRTAELELSVERAKMARQKVELEDLRSDLESKQQAFDASGGAVAQGQPRRRWRDKLGLTGDQ